jgi:hypothetical protein
VGHEFQKRTEDGAPVDDVLALVDIIVPFNMKHNAEHEAIDLLMEVDKLDKVIEHVDDGNLERVCLYLKSCADYVPEPEDTQVLRVTLEIYKKLNRYPAALHMSIRLNDVNEIRSIYESCPDAYVCYLAYELYCRLVPETHWVSDCTTALSRSSWRSSSLARTFSTPLTSLTRASRKSFTTPT